LHPVSWRVIHGARQQQEPFVDHWQSYIPFAVIALVFVLRLRQVNRHRRIHLGRLLVAPVLVTVVALALLISSPPDLKGTAVFIGAMVPGVAVGWQRARFMKMQYDRETDSLSVRISPVAVVFLLAIMVLRRLVLWSAGASAPVTAGAPHAMWPIDGLIGFALAMVVAQNVELWLRARKLREAA
jgi:hypothetical protein